MLLWGLLVAALVTWLIVRSGVLDRLEAEIAERAPQPARVRRQPRLLPHLGGPDACRGPSMPSWWREKSYGRTSQPLGDFLGQGAHRAR